MTDILAVLTLLSLILILRQAAEAAGEDAVAIRKCEESNPAKR